MKLNELFISIDWITTLSMHPDDYNMIYDYEWPKTGDFAKLSAIKSFDQQEIFMDLKKAKGKWYSQGIKFTFHGEQDPITHGK